MRKWILLAAILFAQVAQGSYSGFAHRVYFSIDPANVPNSDQTDFTAVFTTQTVKFSTITANGGHFQNSNGYDFVFSTDTQCGYAINADVEQYDPTLGILKVWVKIPLLSHSTTSYVFMCYGNSAISAPTSISTAAWDSSFVGVWHLSTATVVSPNDSTQYANTLSPINASIATGQIDGGLGLNANGDMSLAVAPTTSGPTTICFWANAPSFSVNNQTPFSMLKATGAGFYFTINTLNVNNEWIGFYSFDGSGTATAGGLGASFFSKSTWHDVCGVEVNNSSHTIYMEGVLVGADSSTSVNVNSLDRMSIGSYRYVTSVLNWLGSLDEVQISNVARTADWIATRHNDQLNPPAFAPMSAEDAPFGTVASNSFYYAGEF